MDANATTETFKGGSAASKLVSCRTVPYCMLTKLARNMRRLKALTGQGIGMNFVVRIEDNKFLKVSDDPDKPVALVDPSNDPELLYNLKRATKVLEKPPAEEVGTEELKQFEQVKHVLQKYYPKSAASSSSSSNLDSAATTESDVFNRQSRDGGATASASSPASRSKLSRRRQHK